MCSAEPWASARLADSASCIAASLLQLRRLGLGGQVVCSRTHSLKCWNWDITHSFWGMTRSIPQMKKLRQNSLVS